MAEEIAVRTRVTGKVQGVWFRGWTRAEASERGLRGWVRNAADGSVDAVIAGPAEKVNAMVAALHEGPEAARVILVETAEAALPEEAEFVIRR